MKMLRITLEGKTYDVGVEVLSDSGATQSSASHAPVAPLPSPSVAALAAPITPPASAAGCQIVSSPMAGNVFKCLVKPGDQVAHKQVLIVLDAMKMESPVVAPMAGIVRAVLVKEGDAVDDGHGLIQLEGLPQ
jgi:biotin carboxyl carrier protein